jgi:hypothetical protein
MVTTKIPRSNDTDEILTCKQKRCTVVLCNVNFLLLVTWPVPVSLLFLAWRAAQCGSSPRATRLNCALLLRYRRGSSQMCRVQQALQGTEHMYNTHHFTIMTVYCTNRATATWIIAITSSNDDWKLWKTDVKSADFVWPLKQLHLTGHINTQNFRHRIKENPPTFHRWHLHS